VGLSAGVNLFRDAPGQAMPTSSYEELKKPTGQSKLASSSLGEHSYEHQMESSTHLVWNEMSRFDVGITPTNEGINECGNP
jgi:hypothetical protein